MSATDKILDQVSGLVALGTHGQPMALAWAELRSTIAQTIGDLERARDAALAERNRLGAELTGARTRIAELQGRVRELTLYAAGVEAERGAALAEAERLRAELDRYRRDEA